MEELFRELEQQLVCGREDAGNDYCKFRFNAQRGRVQDADLT